MVEESDLDDEEEDEVEPYVISFLSEYDVTWDQFVNFDGILATNETLEDDWENKILIVRLQLCPLMMKMKMKMTSVTQGRLNSNVVFE